jgi:hypothetical protein
VTLFQEELQHGFEITPGRSAFFYIGLFGSVLAISNIWIPTDTYVFEPERWMRQIALDTHYYPDDWKNKTHTEQVRSDFSFLFPNKYLVFLQEILSIAFAPLILYKSLPETSLDIVDFFREYTIHDTNLGYVCSFAVFDFEKHGNAEVFGLISTVQTRVLMAWCRIWANSSTRS